MNLYDPLAWSYYYSFPIYLVIPILIRGLTGIIVVQILIINDLYVVLGVMQMIICGRNWSALVINIEYQRI